MQPDRADDPLRDLVAGGRGVGDLEFAVLAEGPVHRLADALRNSHVHMHLALQSAAGCCCLELRRRRHEGATVLDPRELSQGAQGDQQRQGLLVGEPKYKKHIRLYTFEGTPWDYARQLIVASSKFDPYTLKEQTNDIQAH